MPPAYWGCVFWALTLIVGSAMSGMHPMNASSVVLGAVLAAGNSSDTKRFDSSAMNSQRV